MVDVHLDRFLVSIETGFARAVFVVVWSCFALFLAHDQLFAAMLLVSKGYIEIVLHYKVARACTVVELCEPARITLSTSVSRRFPCHRGT